MKLYNGVELPAIGIGPGGMGYVPNGYGHKTRHGLLHRAYMKLYGRRSIREHYIDAVTSAIQTGFRLVDFSAAYGNGGLIADAIERSGVPRAQMFLTGRISNAAQFGGKDSVRKQIDSIITEYRTDYLDLLMFHWPVTGHYESTWEIVCEAFRSGVAKCIGVANCHPHHIERLCAYGLKPMVNQVEVHPLFTQKKLIEYCQRQGIAVEAYTAIARFDDRLMRLPALKKIALSHGKTPPQIVLRWHIQNRCVPVVRSLNPLRQKEDYDIFDFSLTTDEIRCIDCFNINSRLRYDPDNCDFSIL